MKSLAQLKRDNLAAIKAQIPFISYKNGYREHLPGFEEAHQKVHETKALVRERFLSDLAKKKAKT